MPSPNGAYQRISITQYEHGRPVSTAARTVAGRFGGALTVVASATAQQSRDEARGDLATLLDQLRPLLPPEWVLRVEDVATYTADCEMWLALARVWAAFSPELGGATLAYLEGGELATDQPLDPQAGQHPPAPVRPRLRWHGRRVLALTGGSLVVVAAIGAAVVAGSMARGRSR